jgi:hypothetical protein
MDGMRAFSTEGLYVGPLSVEEFLKVQASISPAQWDWTELSPGLELQLTHGMKLGSKTIEVGWRGLEEREWS